MPKIEIQIIFALKVAILVSRKLKITSNKIILLKYKPTMGQKHFLDVADFSLIFEKR